MYTLCTLTVSKLQFRQRAARLRTHGFWLGFRWCSALSDLLPPTLCFCLCRFGTCYGPLTCLDLCSLSVFTYVICIMCFVTVSKLQFGQREARLRTHGFWLGFRWCSAFSHPLPPTSCFCLCRFSTCYGPLTCLDLCRVHTLCTLTVSQLRFRQREARLRTHGFWLVVCILCVCILTVSKLQFRQREARLRTHGFWVGFRWCSAFSHPSPPTSCFCLRRFGNCYGPRICFDLCSVYTLYILTVSKLQFRQREARLRTHGFWLCSAFSHPLPPTSCFCLCRFGTCYGPLTCLDLCSV